MSPTGRRPFLLDIDSGVAVPLMRDAAGCTGPDPITERDMLVDVSTRGTQCGTRKPAATCCTNVPVLAATWCRMSDEAGKAQVRHLAAPQGFHALQVQGFQADDVVLPAQVVRQLPVKRLADMGHPAMDPRQVLVGLVAIARAFLLAGELPVGLARALRLFLNGCGAWYAVPSLPVRYVVNPKSKPALLPVMTRQWVVRQQHRRNRRTGRQADRA